MSSSSVDLLNIFAAAITIVLGMSALYQKLSRRVDLTKYLRFSTILLVFFSSLILGRMTGRLHHLEGSPVDSVFVFLSVLVGIGLVSAVFFEILQDTGFIAAWGWVPVMSLGCACMFLFCLAHTYEFFGGSGPDARPELYLTALIASFFLSPGMLAFSFIFGYILSIGKGSEAKYGSGATDEAETSKRER